MIKIIFVEKTSISSMLVMLLKLKIKITNKVRKPMTQKEPKGLNF